MTGGTGKLFQVSLDTKETEGRPEHDKTGLLDKTTEKGQLRQDSHDRTFGTGSRGSSLKINVPNRFA
jgi:hypothetical protein